MNEQSGNSEQLQSAEALRQAVHDALGQALGDSYECTRVWEAWQVGTMSQDDFSLITDDSDRMWEITDAVLAALAARHPVGAQIVGYMDPEADFMLPRAGDCVLMSKVEVCLWRAPHGKWTKPLYDAPPAPAALPAGLQDIIGSMLNYAGVADTCEVTQGHAPVAIRNWAEMLQQLAAPAAVPADGEGWSGWATQYPGKMPVLRGAREIAELNYYPEEGQRLLFLTSATHPQPAAAVKSDAVAAIAQERTRQVVTEGMTAQGDAGYRRGQLAYAALAYLQLSAMELRDGGRAHIATASPPACWPWDASWWKPRDVRRDLVRAGALIAAQLDAIDQQAKPEVQ